MDYADLEKYCALGEKRAGQPLIMITLSSANAPFAAAMVTLFSSPLLVPCGVTALCPWVSLLPSPLGWVEADHNHAGQRARGDQGNAAKLGVVGMGTLFLHWFAGFARRTISAGHVVSADMLPCTGLIPGCGCADGCSSPPWHHPVTANPWGRKGREGLEMWAIRKAIKHCPR